MLILPAACASGGEEESAALSATTPAAELSTPPATHTRGSVSQPPTLTAIPSVEPAATQPAATGELKSAGVVVTTGKESYRLGEPIAVTIANPLASPIYAPAGGAGCALVAVERLEGDEWVPVDECAGGPPPAPVAVPPGSALAGTVQPPPAETENQGPVVGEAVTPAVAGEDLESAPTAEPWQPGDPTRFVPEGDLALGDLPFSALSDALALGSYRLALHFAVGALDGPTYVAYSPTFVVAGD